uniref:DDE Tnp4 domain-containing protein n=1 Tax=Clastoptera arizonana TaxID=38151 RepID=A0A1B6CKQ4_9HEMI
MDGKHVMLQAPINTGSDYFNYKGFFSIVLLAVVDANYCFTYVSVGCQGRISDGGVFAHSKIKKLWDESDLNLPNPKMLPGRTYPVPYVLLADDAFPLQPNIMKPFPGLHDKGSLQRTFNYRQCRGRRVVENVFGIVSVVFRVLRKPLLLEPENAERIVLTCAHLHNFLRRSESSSASYNPSGTYDSEDASGTLVSGQWRVDGMPQGTLLRLKRIPRKPSELAKEIRKEFAEYFKSPQGSVSWQDKH